MNTIILVDIDGVLALNNFSRVLATYNKILGMRISDDTLARVRDRNTFDLLPEAQAYRDSIGVARYQYRLALLEWHPLCVGACRVVDGAVPGVNYLTQRSNALAYCTARVINFNEAWNNDLAGITRAWLGHSGFPNDDQIVFCDGVKDKLTNIVAMIRKQDRHVMLIDDNPKKLLKALSDLSEADQSVLRDRLTLVAFGYDECDGECPLNVIPFPDWGQAINLAVERSLTYARQEPRWQRE